MKIAIMCPGSFTNGLDSAERGESRWAQNYAKMLAKAGHEVFAASMGIPEPKVHYGVKLILETQCHLFEPFDIYMDSSWWKDKVPKARAKKYVCLKWALETYLQEMDYPDNFYLGYPYPSHAKYFSRFKNADRAFPLPTCFGDTFEAPKWGNEKLFLPGKVDTNRKYQQYHEILKKLFTSYPLEGCSGDWYQTEYEVDPKKPGTNLFKLAPYNDFMDALGRCKLSVPVLNPGCIIEACFKGVPSVFWGEGGFFNPLAENLDVLIPDGAPPERAEEVISLLLHNKKKYHEVLAATQDYFTCHTYSNAMRYFNMALEHIF